MISTKQYVPLTALSVVLFLSYFMVPLLFPDIPTDRLWGRLRYKKDLHKWFLLSTAVMWICYSVVLWFLYTRGERIQRSIVWSLSGFLIFSLLWMPLMYLYMKQPHVYSYMISAVLGATAFFAFWVLFLVWQIRDNSMWSVIAIVSAVYVCFHTFVVDFILFSLLAL